MPRYCWQCEKCQDRREVTRPMKDSGLPEVCDCGTPMDRNIMAEHTAVRGDYKEPIISDSLAFDAIDLMEHRRRFPNVEVHVDHARSARPIFRSLSQKRAYLKGRKCVDVNSFI